MFFWIIMFFNDSFSSFSAMYFLFFSNYLAFTLFFSFFICLSNKFICSFWQPFILLFRALNVFHPFFRFSNNFILGQSILSFAIYHLFVCSSIYSYIQSCIPFSNHYSFFRQWILLSVILNPILLRGFLRGKVTVVCVHLVHVLLTVFLFRAKK